MNDRAVIRGLIRQGAQINIIGDSLAAGAGSSDSYSTEKVILHDGEDVFVRRAAPNSWWSRFQNYIDDKYPGCTVVNNGCGGAFSFQLKNHLPSVFQEDKDDIIFLFLGANDRKRVNGMDELRSNLTWMIRYFKGKNKSKDPAALSWHQDMRRGLGGGGQAHHGAFTAEGKQCAARSQDGQGCL